MNAIDDTIRRMQERWKNSPVLNSPRVPFLNIELSQHTVDRYTAWLEKCYAKAVEKQRAEFSEDDPGYEFYSTSWDAGYPYHGAIGGEVHFTIGSTSLGHTVKAHYDYIDETIDLTEYDLW